MWSSGTGPAESIKKKEREKGEECWLCNENSWAIVHGSIHEGGTEKCLSNSVSCYIWFDYNVLANSYCHTFLCPCLMWKCDHHTYSFGDEISTNYQVILGDPSIAWKNWKEPDHSVGHTKTVIHTKTEKIAIILMYTKVLI